MTMIGGLDVHRQQITFDYVDSDGLVRWGQIRPATRKTLRGWLAEHYPDSDAEFALEGCTGWRYVVEELRAAGFGAHLGDPAESRCCRVRRSGPRPTVRMRGCRAVCCWRAGSRSRGSRRRTWWRAAPGPVVLHADGRATRLAAAHPRPAVSPGLPTDQGAAVGGGSRGARPCRAVGSGTSVRRHRAAAH